MVDNIIRALYELVGTADLRQVEQALDDVDESMGGLKSGITSISDAIDKSFGDRPGLDFNKQLQFDAVSASAKQMGKDISNSLRQAEKDAKRMDFTFLSLIFTGMAISRIFQSAFKGMYNSFKKIENNTSLVLKKITSLQAAFEFLKFSIFNALEQSGLFMTLINWLISIIDFVSDLINKFPVLGDILIGIFAAGALIGGLLQFLGLIKQIEMLMKSKFMINMAAGFKDMWKALLGINPLLLGFLALLLIGGIAITKFPSLKKEVGESFKGVGTAIGELVGSIVGIFVPAAREADNAMLVLATTVAWLSVMFSQGFRFIFNVVKIAIDGIMAFINMLVGEGITKLAKAAQAIAGWFGKDLNIQPGLDAMNEQIDGSVAKAEKSVQDLKNQFAEPMPMSWGELYEQGLIDIAEKQIIAQNQMANLAVAPAISPETQQQVTDMATKLNEELTPALNSASAAISAGGEGGLGLAPSVDNLNATITSYVGETVPTFLDASKNSILQMSLEALGVASLITKYEALARAKSKAGGGAIAGNGRGLPSTEA